jgi:hypothetical protein
MQLSMNISGLTVVTVRLHHYSSQSVKSGEKQLCADAEVQWNR